MVSQRVFLGETLVFWSSKKQW